VSAVQVLIEQVMREELEQCIGDSWGECTPTRRGYRNGSYTRALVTPTGRMEGLKVPRDREGQFHSQVFERYSRYEPEVAEALTQMFVSGVSTHKVGEVAQTLTGVAPSASAVSRLNRTLTEQYEAWRERRLLPHYRILYLRWHPFHGSSWHPNRCDHDFNGPGSGSRGQQRSAGLAPVPRKTKMGGVVSYKICVPVE
jgi:transposase-like protein